VLTVAMRLEDRRCDPVASFPRSSNSPRVNTSPGRDPSIRRRGAQPCWATPRLRPCGCLDQRTSGCNRRVYSRPRDRRGDMPAGGRSDACGGGDRAECGGALGRVRRSKTHGTAFTVHSSFADPDPPRIGSVGPHRCRRARSRGVASGAWFGSNMRGAPNTSYGCESALILGPIGGVELASSRQVTCSYRSAG
jgi:hypothetical protein